MFLCLFFFFFFNDTATTEIYTLSLHDALPISAAIAAQSGHGVAQDAVEHAGQRLVAERGRWQPDHGDLGAADRKSTRLNSSHTVISYAVFCLKKKKKQRKLIGS